MQDDIKFTVQRSFRKADPQFWLQAMCPEEYTLEKAKIHLENEKSRDKEQVYSYRITKTTRTVVVFPE
jgi:hypothetical protein